MTNVSAFPISVDGRRLDDLAVGVEWSSVTLGGLRTDDAVLPGRDGEVASLSDSREPSLIGLGLMIRGTDENGIVPYGSHGQEVYQQNLDALKHLLCQAGKLVTVRRVMDPVTTAEATNLVTNPTFGNGTTGYDVGLSGATLAHITPGYDTDTGAGGSGRITAPSANTGALLWNSGSLAVGTSWNVSFMVRCPNLGAGQTAVLNVGAYFGNGSAVTVTGPDWVRVSAGFTVTTGQTVNKVGLTGIQSGIGSGHQVQMDMVQLTAGTNLLPYFDGRYPGAWWSGGPDQSTSVRGSSDREALAKVVDALTPSESPGNWGRLAVTMRLPGVYWRDTFSLDWAQVVTSGTEYEPVRLRNATAPIDDLIFTLAGPASSGVTVVDAATGDGVRLNQALAAGEVWRVNSATWSAKVATGLTVASSDAAGLDVGGTTAKVGPYPVPLRLVPRLISDQRAVKVKVTGSGFTSATTLTLRAKRAYL